MSASMSRRTVALGALLSAALAPSGALATYSIVAADPASGTTVCAVASCVPLTTLRRVCGVAPGRGALVTQSFLKDGARADALAWLAAGLEPDEIVAALISPEYDAAWRGRQYAVVDVAGLSAQFTGPDALGHASGQQFDSVGHRVAIQGNLLTGPEVISQARVAFEAEGCDVAERALRALEAAGSAGAGDARCVGDGLPAESAVLVWDRPGGPLYLEAERTSSAAADPVLTLRDDLAGRRADHPCPAPPVEPAPSEPGGDGDPDGARCASAPDPISDLGWLAALWLLLGAATSRRLSAPRRA